MSKSPPIPKENTEFLGVKLPVALVAAIRRGARRDDRTVSSYVRRLLADVLPVKDENRRG